MSVLERISKLIAETEALRDKTENPEWKASLNGEVMGLKRAQAIVKDELENE